MLEREIRDFSTVQRWSIVRSIHRQTVAEHSHAVAVYSDQIAAFFGWSGDHGALLRYALWHDAFELASGDIPGPTKRLAMKVSEEVETTLLAITFPDREWQKPDDPVVPLIVKMADCLDELFWLLTERRLGNTTLTSLTDQSIFRARRAYDALPFEEARKVEFWETIMDAVTEHREGQFRIVGEKSAPKRAS